MARMKEPDEGWNNILFRREWAEILRKLPNNLRLAVWDAIGEYILTGNDPKDENVLYSPYLTIKTQIEKDKDNYNKTIVERNRRNGQKGGRPKAENENPNKPKKPNGLLKTQINPKNPQKPEREKEKEREDVLSYDKIEEDKSSLSTIVDAECEISVVEVDKKNAIDFKKLMEYFNVSMQGKAIKPIARMTDKRKSMLAARCREYGKEAIQQVITNAANSSFLNGRGNHGFVANFDWLIRPNNFVKVLEGNYADRPTLPPARILRQEQERQCRQDDAMARILRLREIDEAEKQKEA